MDIKLKDPGALSPEERDYVAVALAGLVVSLNMKRTIGGHGTGLISDEEMVLTSLLHPERGDVIITLLRGQRHLELFVSNRREESSPFAVMNRKEADRHSGRRVLNGNIESLKEENRALFIITVQDRDMLAHAKPELRVDIFSVHFGTAEAKPSPVAPAESLQNKKLELCSLEEKWDIYKKNMEHDPRLPLIEKELFAFKVRFAKYKQPEKEDAILLTPEKAKQYVGQFIRDMYPYGVRTTLRHDFPNDHKAKLKDVYEAIQRLSDAVRLKTADGIAPAYQTFLLGICEMLDDIHLKDPELSGFA